jgi:CheY-like chemotaxis protein
MQRHDLTVVVNWTGKEELQIPEDQTVLLFQSVRELLMNASKHAESATAYVTVERHDRQLTVEVRDDGCGFDPDAVDQGANPMSSKFGLFSVRERMAALGGRFSLESSPGNGTKARLTLPLTGEHPSSAPAAERSSTSERDTQTAHAGMDGEPRTVSIQDGKRVRVLLVDDHTVVRQGLRTLLESYADTEVVGEAGNGLEAVSLADALCPDVVVMDVNMPVMDGVEATARIKTARPSTIVVGLSMHISGHYEQKMNEAGAAAYLSKESVADQLHAMIMACRQAAQPGMAGRPH